MHSTKLQQADTRQQRRSKIRKGGDKHVLDVEFTDDAVNRFVIGLVVRVQQGVCIAVERLSGALLLV